MTAKKKQIKQETKEKGRQEDGGGCVFVYSSSTTGSVEQPETSPVDKELAAQRTHGASGIGSRILYGSGIGSGSRHSKCTS